MVNSVAFTGLRAQPVDTDQAKSVAERYFADRLSRSSSTQLKSVQAQDLEFFLVHEEKVSLSYPGNLKNSDQSVPLYYIFNVMDNSDPTVSGGFIIVSADQRIPAVLGYSFSGECPEFDQSSALNAWMDHYKEQIIYVIKNNLKPDPETTDEWKKYSGTGELKSAEQINEVEPLLATKWCQYSYYNLLCPAEPALASTAFKGHAPAGCAAVAMAQIMKYWNYPTTNNLIPGYDPDNYEPQPDVGVTAYDWANMPPTVDQPNPTQPSDAEIEAVSTLIYHCGVALEMNYGPEGSGAGSPVEAFTGYFKYSPDIQDLDKDGYTDEDWGNLLKNELDNGRPVYYSGYADDAYSGGHSWVCEGYQDENHFYMNWGLSYNGIGNGYFYLDDLTYGSKDFNFEQWAVIGISPVSSLVDADGNYYDVVEIGSQVWMAENLKTTKYNDETPIPNVTDQTAWINLSTDAYCWYDNNAAAYKSTYGALYNWYAVNTGKLCPAGWHVPSRLDWVILENYLLANGYNYDNTTSGNKYAKALASTTLWDHSDYEGVVGNTDYPEKRNATGFTAVPSGFRSSIGPFNAIGRTTGWWSSSWYSDDEVFPGERVMAFSTPNLNWAGDPEKHGNPVRCMIDASDFDILVDTEAFTFGNIGSAGEEDWYRFQTGLAGTYAMETRGSTDTYMHLYNEDQSLLIAEDNDGAGSGQNARIVMNLDANTEYYIRITGNSGSIGSYSIGVMTVPDAPEANDVTVAYDGLLHEVGATTPPGISIVWYDATTGGNETTQPTATNCGTYTAYAEAVNDVTGAKSLNRTSVTLTINPLVLYVTADYQTSQYSDPLQDLTYEITGFVNGEDISVIGGDPDISTTATQFSAPGEYDIIVGAGSLSADNYTFDLVKGLYTLSQEDARTQYTGSNLVATTGATSGNAIVSLRATVQDITATDDPESDIYPGDIRNARVRFLNEGAAITGTGTDMDGWMTPSLVNPSDLKTGVVALNWPVDIGGKTDVIYTIGIEVNNYYVRNSSLDNTVLTIYKPSGDFITGGGFIINPENTEGTFAADPGLKTNFGFNVKFNKKGKNLKGKMNIIFRRTVDGAVHNFQIKSNSMTSLGVNIQDAEAQKAVFVSKATLRDLTDPIFGYSKGGLTLQVNMTDKGEPGSNDEIAISVYDKSMLLFSSNWTGISTEETVIAGGNLVVHSGFSLNKDITKSSAIVTGDTRISQAESEMIAFPNPFNDRIFFDFQLMDDSEVQLEIFDITGSKIATVYNGTVLADVRYRFEYVPEYPHSGTYIYRLMIGGQQLYTGILIRE